MPVSLSHITISASDFAGSLAFYDATLGALGLVRAVEFGDEEEDHAAVEAAGWGPVDETPVLWLVAGPGTTGFAHVAFHAATRQDVKAFHAAALAAGGRSHDAPRRWVLYRRGEFSAIVADPDGNLLEAVAPE